VIQLLCWSLGANVGSVEPYKGSWFVIDRDVSVRVSLVLLLCLIENGGGLELS
jgi:hypothetical protein